MTRRLIITAILLSLSLASFGQRTIKSINDSWQFRKDIDGADWEIVDIPHTWNADDSIDDIPGYYRGLGIYKRTISITENLDGCRLYIHFEGANQEATVLVNGHQVGSHIGGYSAFCFDITDMVKPGDNLFEIHINNRHNPDIPPLSADFTFFGGIYRDVYLISTPATHISTTHYATNGVYLNTPEVSEEKAELNIRTMLTNTAAKPANLVVEHRIVAPDGKEITLKDKVKVPAGTANYETAIETTIDNPQLWDIDNPQLYRVYTTLKDRKGAEMDLVSNSLGFRWYSFDPNEGFTLNGRYRKLVGTNRHQDYYKLGNALRDEMHVRDIRLLKDMGGNFLRIAHYPQDPIVNQMCDREGIVTSIEIPIINEITLSEEFEKVCLTMTEEMVWQNFNSPSVIMWAYMNEVMLRPPYNRKDKEAKQTYIDFLYRIASKIENTLRTLDTERYTMIPSNSTVKVYKETGITDLPMVLGWNLYKGWYSRDLEEFDKSLAEIRETFPNQAHLVTEYGADTDPRLHTFLPERFDFTNEYGMKYHQYYLPIILNTKWIAGSNIWNLNDFYSESRHDAVPHTNNKGITGLDRERKDLYWLYQACLSPKPVLKIGYRTWKNRGGVESGDGQCVQPIEVYTNAPEVELFINGRSLGVKPVENCTARFDVPYSDGENELSASAVKDGVKIIDFYRMNFSLIPSDLNRLTTLNVLLGSNRYFEDRTAEMVWIPEQEYKEGSWGYVGGEPVKSKTRHGALPCLDIDLFGTDQDPIWQTQRKSLQSFKADVPDGQYYIYLYFAELISGKERAKLAYNLGQDTISEKASDRVFDVAVNGDTVLKDFDIAREYGPERAVIKKVSVTVSGGKGLSIDFIPIKGEPVLNAIRIYRCF